jgi:hypothetical protein
MKSALLRVLAIATGFLFASTLYIYSTNISLQPTAAAVDDSPIVNQRPVGAR